MITLFLILIALLGLWVVVVVLAEPWLTAEIADEIDERNRIQAQMINDKYHDWDRR